MSFTSISHKNGLLLWAVAAALLLCTFASHAFAGHAAAYDGATGPTATAPSPQEAADSDPEAYLPYLFAVYAVTWAAFFGYIFLISRKQREMQQELTALRAALQDKNKLAK